MTLHRLALLFRALFLVFFKDLLYGLAWFFNHVLLTAGDPLMDFFYYCI